MKEFIILAVLCTAVLATCIEAQDVKYCKNYETGEIIVVSAGMPCPYPTVEI